MNKKGIVLNRMYVGDYLSTNLGHEVINMFQADDNNHYLYLNAKGNFGKRGKDVDTMLLVMGIGEGRVEVVGMAKNLQCVDGACCTLPRDLGETDYKTKTAQENFLKKVKYGKAPIFDIFGTEGQQSVYASYWVDNKNFFVPKDGVRLIIAFSNSPKPKKDDTDSKDCVTLANHKFASTSLHQFILEGEDLDKLTEICKTDGPNTFWELSNKRIDLDEYNNNRQISLFDICQIQNDENRFSNAISYFIQQYPELWQRLLQDKAGIKDLDKIESVTREKDAKVDKGEYKDKTGGRIDLLIRTKKYYIIIENKIDSNIINENGVTQLSRYYHYVKYLKEEQLNILKKEKKEIEEQLGEFQKKLKNPRNKKSEYRDNWEEAKAAAENELRNIDKQINEVNNRSIVGLVLTPNYNPQGTDLLNVEYLDKKNKEKMLYIFKEITYGDVYQWLRDYANTELESDINFKYFYDAMKRHTYDHESKALYDDMLTKFVRRINIVNKRNLNTKSIVPKEKLQNILNLANDTSELDRAIEQEYRRKKELWNESILKWRGVSFDEFTGLYGSTVATFDVGAEVYFMNNDKCVCDKVKAVHIFIDKETRVLYSVDSIKDRRLDSDFVFVSKVELEEHLRLGIVNPRGYGKGYGASDFKTAIEDVQRTGYSIKHYDVLSVGSRVWVMHDNKCEEKYIHRIHIEITEDGQNISYVFEFWNGHSSEYIPYLANKVFATKEELLKTIE